jgi:type IV pilus assembly protein PilB
VLSTLHTNDAPGSITRFVDMGIEPFLVATVMIVSFAQRLVRTVCPSCKAPYKPPAEALKFWGLDKVKNANFQQGQGCFNCMHTGYKGRSGVYEVLLIDDLVKDLILKRASSHEIARVAAESGEYRTLKENAAEKVILGITSLEEAASAVMV